MNALAPNENKISESQMAFVKEVIAPNCTENDIVLLLHIAQKYELDPLVGEVYAMKYKDKPARVFVSHAGMIKIAHMQGLEGIESELILDPETGKVLGATARVYKCGCTHAFQRTVQMREYNTGKSVWAEKPATMIVKVAEAQALRLAFPISGVYIQEEFVEQPQAPKPAPVIDADVQNRKIIDAVITDEGVF